MQPFRIEPHYNESPTVSRRLDPWNLEPDLTQSGTLGSVLDKKLVGVLAAHVLATVPGAKESDEVIYRAAYPKKRGHGSVMDLQYKGVLYRQAGGLIYTKRVGQ